MKTAINQFNLIITFILLILTYNCSNDDDSTPQFETWELEVQQAVASTNKYFNIAVAENEGRIDVSGYIPNMGHHYMNPNLVDGIFDINNPEFILYLPDDNNEMQMVAIEYGIVPEDPENPGNPPEGFTGDADIWHYNEHVGQWQLHVWTVLENPDGIFAAQNPTIGD